METGGRQALVVRVNLKIPKLKFGVFAGLFTQSLRWWDLDQPTMVVATQLAWVQKPRGCPPLRDPDTGPTT